MLEYASGELCFEGCRLRAAAAAFETPFFLLSERRLLGNLGALRDGLAAGEAPAAVRHAAKANNELAVLRRLSAAGTGVMVSHVDEARLATRAGYAPSEVWLQRAALTRREVRATLELGVDGFHASCPEDAVVVEEVAREAGVPVRVVLRLRPRPGLSPLGHLVARTGLEHDEAAEAAATLGDSRWTELTGVNVYAGTQHRSPRRLVAELRRMVELTGSLTGDPGVRLSEIIVGGGVPSPTLRLVRPGTLLSRLRDAPLPTAFRDGISGDRSHDDRLDGDRPPGDGGYAGRVLRDFARILARRYTEACRRAGLEPMPRLVLEVGRSLVGDAGVLVTRVVGRRGRWLFVDASRGHLPESPLRFWRPVLPAVQPATRRRRLVHVVGSRVNTMDVVEPWRRLPPLAAGDLLVVGAAGAYSITRADRYAGLPPRVVWLGADGDLRTVRRPEDVDDLAAPMGVDEDAEGPP